MTFTDFVYWLGDVFQASFKIIEGLEMLPNYFFMVVITLAVCIWVWRMSKYRTEARRTNTLE